MYRYSTRLSLGAVASAAVIVVGFASMTGSAYADHTTLHAVENLKSRLGALEQRVWDCEHSIEDACLGTTGPQGPEGPIRFTGETGAQGLQGPIGLKGDTGDTGAPGTAADVSDIQDQIDDLRALLSEKLIFVTSSTHTGNLGGVDGADIICNDLADAASLPGEYKAWLATYANNDPESTFKKSLFPYRLPSGALVADNWRDLTDGNLDGPINEDERGVVLTSGVVWTNVLIDGTSNSSGSYTCNAFTSNQNTVLLLAKLGSIFTANSYWTHLTFSNCATPSHLYCVGQ